MRLGDEVAIDIVKEAARARLEAGLDAALEVIKRRTRARDYSEAITEVRRATGHSAAFRSMSCDAAAASWRQLANFNEHEQPACGSGGSGMTRPSFVRHQYCRGAAEVPHNQGYCCRHAIPQLDQLLAFNRQLGGLAF